MNPGQKAQAARLHGNPCWLVATGDDASFDLFLLRGGGEIAGDPWLLTLPAERESPLCRNLDRWGECALHLIGGSRDEALAASLLGGALVPERRRGYFVRSPLLPVFPLALECLVRERVDCLDRLLYIAELAFSHAFSRNEGD